MAEAAVMETKPCDNCKKDVPVGNYLNHSIHCPRNIRLCPRCNEPYPIIEMESHIDEDHAEVVCPECYEFMEAADLPAHKTDSCPKRLVSCIICEVDLPASELGEHLDYCGSRSDRCDGCGKLVLLKHQPFHISTRHRLVKPETELQQAQCMEQFLNQYKKVTSSGNEQNINQNRSTNSNKQTGNNSARSTNIDINTRGSSSSSISSSTINGVNSGTQSDPSRFSTNNGSNSGSQSNPNGLSSRSQIYYTKSSTSNNSMNTGTQHQQLHQTATSAGSSNNSSSYLNSSSSSSANNFSSSSSSTSNATSNAASSSAAVSTSLVSPLKSSSSPSIRPSSATLPSSSSYIGSLPAPSPSVVALLEPVFNDPSSSTLTGPSSIGSTLTAHSPLTAPSTLRNNPIQPLTHIAARSNASSMSSNALSTTSSKNNSSIRPSTNIAPSHVSRAPSTTNSSSNSWSDPPSVATLRNVEHAIRECVDSISAGLRVGSTMGSISSSLNTLRSQASGNTVGSSANVSNYEEEGAASLESQFNSRPQSGPKFEVLRPNGSEPSDRMKPVNRPPLQTRRRNYQDDVLTEYMHLLDEQGLSNGLDTNTSKSSTSKPTRNTTTTSNTRPSTTNNLINTNPYNGGARFVQEEDNTNPYNAGARFVNEDTFDVLNGGVVGARRGLRDRQQHIAPRETVKERADRMRREREREELTALTRTTELRGLNQALNQERQVVNQTLDEEAALCLPCEFCDAPIPMDHLILHQTGCRPDLIYH